MGKLEDMDEIDKLLYEHCPKVDELLLSKLPSEYEIDYEFSNRFKRNMKKMIREQKRNPIVSKLYKVLKVAVVFIAISISLFSVSMSVDAFRIKVLDVIKEVYDEFSVYNYKGSMDKPIGSITDYNPQYIPKGFEIIDKTEDENYLLIQYKNNMEYISYNCYEINNSRVYVDTENATITEVDINGVKGDYISKDKFDAIIWQKDGYGYHLSIESIDEEHEGFDKEVLIKIAKSIK